MRRLTKISGDRSHLVLKDPIFLNFESFTEIDVIIKETHQGLLKGIDKDFQYMVIPLDKVEVPSLHIKKDDEEYKKERAEEMQSYRKDKKEEDKKGTNRKKKRRNRRNTIDLLW